MKAKIILQGLLPFLFALLAFQAISQFPQKFNYQAVIRNEDGIVLANQSIALKLSLTSSDGSTTYYSEVQTVHSTAFGVINLIVGDGNVEIGTMDNLPWSVETVKLKIEVKLTGESDYTLMGSTALMTVPYSQIAGNGFTSIVYNNNGTFTYTFANGTTYTTPDLTGPQGSQGTQGVQGDKGDKGEVGPVGPQGDIGPAGDQGSTGAQGPIGQTGPQGETGPMGPIGPQGPAGTGLTNRGAWSADSTYQTSDYVFDDSSLDPLVNTMWICQANVGPTNTQPKGNALSWVEFEAPQGDTGPQGPQGIPGPKGDTGPQGAVGPEGPQGDTGATGLTGDKGDTGETGAQGEKGDKGDQGETGVKGEKGDTGLVGADGISIIWRGEYMEHPIDQSTNHAYYNTTVGKSYIWDGDSWEILVQDGGQGIQGEQGAQGEQGLPGAKGDQGEPGENGLSIIWKGDLPSEPVEQPSTNWAYYNTADKKAYIYNGTSWDILAQDGAIGATGPLVTGDAGQILVHNGTTWVASSKITVNADTVGIGTGAPLSKLVVKADAGAAAEDPIFEVRNKDGNLVFGVYNEGVRVYVNDSTLTKARKGGFAVGGLTNQTKGDGVEYFRVTPDSARFWVRDLPDKARKGGFAVGGLTNQTKGDPYNLMFIGRDSSRIWVNDSISTTKSRKGGFAVGGLTNQTKGSKSNFLKITPDSARIYVNETNPNNNFSVKGINTSLNKMSDYLNFGRKTSNIISRADSATNYDEYASWTLIADRWEGGSYTVADTMKLINAGFSSLTLTYPYDEPVKGPLSGFYVYAGKVLTKGKGMPSRLMHLNNYNLSLGKNAGLLLTSGLYNSLIGYEAGQNIQIGAFNTCIGYQAGYTNISGNYNIVIGNKAGYTYSAGSGNLFIGNWAGQWETSSGRFYLDNTERLNNFDQQSKAMFYGQFNSAPTSQYLRINARVGIGGPWSTLHSLYITGDAFATGNITATNFIATMPGDGAYMYNSTLNMNVPDYVFDYFFDGESSLNNNYKILNLDDLRKYISENRHLPGIPSRKEIERDGTVNIQALSMVNLEKTEENTLYILELEKKMQVQQERINQQNSEIEMLKIELELIKEMLKK